MIVLESEAGEYLCPVIQGHERCAGAKCMGWRQHYEFKIHPSRVLRAPDMVEPIRTDRGYCGMTRITPYLTKERR